MHNSKRDICIIRHIEDSVCKCFRAAGIRNVLVGVSGGADSVALLCACVRTACRIGLQVEAANCNFHLRGDESDRDSTFTVHLCRRLGVAVHTLDYDVAAYLEENPGISTEMACRDLRYADFLRLLRERNLDRVAVAHNADDDTETMLLNLLRGSGSRGLRGMETDNGQVVRPLLGVTRKDIEAYLSEIGQEFITDSSNLTSDYRRNFIRRDIIPKLESRWPGVRKSLTRTLSIMKEESEIVESHFRSQLADLSPDPQTLLIYSEGVTTGLILRFIEPFGGNPAIAQEIMDGLNSDFCARSWRLSELHTAILERDRLIITDRNRNQDESSIIWEGIPLTPELMTEIRGNRSHDIVYLPKDASAYEIRRPRIGDRMAPLGMKGTRLVSDIISDAKLNYDVKARIRVLVRKSDGEIIWVTGLKRSRHDLVDPSQDSVFKVKHGAADIRK